MKSNLLKRITAVLLCMVIGVISSFFVLANAIEDRYYTGLRQAWGAGQIGTSVVNGEPLEGQLVTCLDYAALYDKGELVGTAFADKIRVNVNEPLPADYGANGLVLGLQEAETVVPFAPDGFDCNSTGIYDDTATFNKCTNAIFLVGEIGAGGAITPINDLRGKIGVLYKNIGTYYGKHVDMKVTVSDYVINADDNYRYNFKQADGTYKTRYNAVIGLYTTTGKPGITVRNIPWVELTYEFFELGTTTPISIKGNTSYYDIDEFQAVFLDGTCKEIYVTDGEVEGSYVDEKGVSHQVTLESGAHNRCVLNLGWLDNLRSGVGVYSSYSVGVSSSISNVYTANGFTEVFEGSKMTRTFSFQNANYPNATSNAPDGNIGHSGLPVNEKETGTKIEVDKSWIGGTEPLEPDEIPDVTIYAGLYKTDGTATSKYVELNQSNNWKDEFAQLVAAENYIVKELRSVKAGETAEFTINGSGYIAAEEKEGIVIDGKGYTVTYSGNHITNTLMPITLQVVKVDAGNEKIKLQGAQFELKNAAGTVVGTGTTNADGIAEFRNLKPGTYALTETVSPTGYAIAKDPISITLSNSDLENTVVEQIITNEILHELPATGGHGTYWYICGGLVLMLGATLMLYINRRKIIKKNEKF